MKKILLIILLSLFLSASHLNVEREIYQTILKALFPKKDVVKVWSDEENKAEMFRSMENVIVVEERSQADILMLFSSKRIGDVQKPVFANGYLVFQRTKGKAVGGFYWQKGRPNLVFIKKRLQEDGITLPENLQKYIEDIE